MKLRNKKRILTIAALAMTLLLTLGSVIVLHGQEKYVPPEDVQTLDAERSQVYLAGTGYEVDQKQKQIHQKTEEERQQIKQDPVTPRSQPKQVNLSRPVQKAASSGTSGNGSAGRSGSAAKKPTKSGGTKKPTSSGGKDPTEAERTKEPEIKTSLINGQEVSGTRLDFWVTVTDGYGRNIPVFSESDGSFTVTCNGSPASSIGVSGKKTSFRMDLLDGRNEIVISAIDRRGLTKTITRWVRGNTAAKAEVIGQIHVSIEAPILNLGVLYDGYLEIINGDSAKDVLQAAFEQGGFTADFKGGYLEGIRRPGIAEGAYISDDVREVMEDRRQTEKDPDKQDRNRLKERDFYDSSGWIYLVNGEMPEVGLGSYQMEDGDELVLVFSLAEGVY